MEMLLDDGPDDSVRRTLSFLEGLTEVAGIDRGSIRITVAGLPSPLDEDGHALNPSAMGSWSHIDARYALGEAIGTRVVIENDANLMALGAAAEHRDVDSLVFVKIAAGVGAGIVAGRRLQRGLRGMAGEIGHVPVSRRPEVACACGNRGCLGEVASVPALIQELRDSGVPIETLEDLETRALHGDPAVVATLRQAGRDIGEALLGVIAGVAPEVLVLGGRVARLGDHVLAGVRESVYARALPALSSGLRIQISADHERAAARGGSLLGVHSLLETRRA
jgi:predicted NBD/HSP70 family sugar kinase